MYVTYVSQEGGESTGHEKSGPLIFSDRAAMLVKSNVSARKRLREPEVRKKTAMFVKLGTNDS